MAWRRAGLFLAAATLLISSLGAAADVKIRDLDDRLVDPFAAPASAKVIVFLFVSVECPISNRYAPRVSRLHDKFAPKGVAFSLVYPNPIESVATIRRHLKEYSYPIPALRDPRHALVKIARATITPEAAVFDRGGRLLYHGRIDDRYVSLGLERPAATRDDLDEVLTDVVAGRPPRQTFAQAVGCFIADFVP